jgi:dGTPase
MLNFIELMHRAIIERTIIEDSKQFGRSHKKTQVQFPRDALSEVVKNRASHSFEVATSSLMMVIKIAMRKGLRPEDIDYQQSVHNVSLLHDIGHPPFGHDGTYYLQNYLAGMGFTESFTDNNNNLTIIEKHKLDLCDYTIASVIKYPDELYDSQKKKYLPMLARCIEEDRNHYAKLGINLVNQTKTISCQIMDEADRNSYTCTDLSDFLSMGNTLNEKKLLMLSKSHNLTSEYIDQIKIISKLARTGSKNDIRVFFSELKQRFNANYDLTDNGIETINLDLENYREFLNDVSLEFYIKPIRKMDLHIGNMTKLMAFTDHVFNKGFHPSKHYSKMIADTDCEEEKIRYKRDMITEVSDWYVVNTCEELGLEINNDNWLNSDYGRTYK